METIRLPAGVGLTALQVAAERARESDRPDALFVDPLAREVITHVEDENGQEWSSSQWSATTRRQMGDYVAIRTHFIDEKMLSAAENGLRQVVILAAGVDGRGYRLDWPSGTKLYEFDRPELQAFKRKIVSRGNLQPTVDLVPISGDLNDDWLALLQEAGFVAEQPTLWLLEGLLRYLTADEADRLAARLSSASTPGSRLVAVYTFGDEARSARRAREEKDESMSLLLSLARGGPSAEPEAWLSHLGWTVDATTIADWAHRLERSVPPVMDTAQDGIACYLVDAVM